MNKTRKLILTASLLMAAAGCSQAAQDTDKAVTGLASVTAVSDENALKARSEEVLRAAFGPSVAVREAVSMAAGQLLEVVLVDGSIIHMTPDMGYLVYRGELYKLDGEHTSSETEKRQNPMRAAALAAIDDKDTVVFPAKGTQKALINVFTDIDCGYCQKLHQEVPRLNEMGITVRYLAYPRAGIRDQGGRLTDSFRKINYVWCQGDRKAAMTDLKTAQRDVGMLGRQLSSGDDSVKDRYGNAQETVRKSLADVDCGAPIEKEYRLGAQLGVTGTPAIFVEDGRLFPGYLPAEELARRIGNI